MELRYASKIDPPCVIIEKVEGMKLIELDHSPQILSSLIYIAIQKSYEMNLGGNVAVRFTNEEWSKFFPMVQFHSRADTLAILKRMKKDPAFQESGTPSSRTKQYIQDAIRKKANPEVLLVPNTFEKITDKLEISNSGWVINFFSRLKKHAREKDFPAFDRLVEDVFLFTEREIIALKSMLDTPDNQDTTSP